MKGLMAKLGGVFQAIGSILAMPFVENKTQSRLHSAVRWGFHALCVLVILGGLTLLNYSLKLDRVLVTPIAELRYLWLPAVFLLVYSISWIGWWTFRMLSSPSDQPEYADIYQEWRRIQRRLTQRGIDLLTTPVFLLLGSPRGGAEQFLNAALIENQLPKNRDGQEMPFQVFASSDAVYVCCESSSLLGEQSQLIHHAQEIGETRRRNRSDQRTAHHAKRFGSAEGDRSALNRGIEVASESSMQTESQSCEETVAVRRASKSIEESPLPVPLASEAAVEGENVSATQPAVALPDGCSPSSEQRGKKARSESQSSVATASLQDATSPSAVTAYETLSVVESNIALLDTELDRDAQKATSRRKPTYQPCVEPKLPLLQDENEIKQTCDRLRYLCKLITEAREPFCSLNGVVTLIPYSCLANDRTANHCGMLIERDLAVVQQETQLALPRIAVVCDIQQETGSLELLTRFPEQQRDRRLGIKFPYIPQCDLNAVDRLVSTGIDWLCSHMIPPLVNRLFETERTSGIAEASATSSNERLYSLMNSLRQRQAALQRLIRRGFLSDSSQGRFLRGCYLAATGSDSFSSQGFSAGIVQQISEMQNDVQWSEEALQDDRERRCWTRWGYTAIATIGLVSIVLLIL